jgi:hypothetical protein
MTIQRMENVGVVIDDLAAATAFFLELGLLLEGEAPVEGPWVDRVVGLDGARVDVAMVRTPDGHGRLELIKFHTPAATTVVLVPRYVPLRRPLARLSGAEIAGSWRPLETAGVLAAWAALAYAVAPAVLRRLTSRP